MSREIKFRAWDGEKYTTTFCVTSQGCIRKHLIGLPHEDLDYLILEQFTGIKDKNGVEIYFDSDIVEYTYQVENDYGNYEETVTGTVVLDLKFTNSLCIKRKGGSMYHFTASEVRNLEIIGNAHQNPELIKEAQ